MTLTATLRRAAPGDLPGIASIEAASFHRPWRTETFASLLRRPDADVLVASLEGTVVGYAVLTAQAGEAELANLAVDPGHRRRGIASALLRECLKILKDRGACRVLLAVRASNRMAATLYGAFGFQEIGRHRGYYGDPAEDAVIFGLEVGRTGPGEPGCP